MLLDMYNLTGMNIVQGNGTLKGTVAVYSQLLNVSWALGSDQSQWSPWFYVDDPGIHYFLLFFFFFIHYY